MVLVQILQGVCVGKPVLVLVSKEQAHPEGGRAMCSCCNHSCCAFNCFSPIGNPLKRKCFNAFCCVLIFVASGKSKIAAFVVTGDFDPLTICANILFCESCHLLSPVRPALRWHEKKYKPSKRLATDFLQIFFCVAFMQLNTLAGYVLSL